jgi:hypothetical protein
MPSTSSRRKNRILIELRVQLLAIASASCTDETGLPVSIH